MRRAHRGDQRRGAGDNERALQTAVAAERDYDGPRLRELKQRAAANLRAANQYLDPFKFAVYARMVGAEVAFTEAADPPNLTVATMTAP